MTDLEIGKVTYILTQKYNIFHADLIARAIQDDSMSIEDFWSGCLTIDAAGFKVENGNIIVLEAMDGYGRPIKIED